jgi:hypothetical protein
MHSTFRLGLYDNITIRVHHAFSLISLTARPDLEKLAENCEWKELGYPNACDVNEK